MANPRFLSGSSCDLAQVSVQKSSRLAELLNGVMCRDTISVVLPDCTRPLPFEEVLPLVETSFPNMQQWIVGLGLHRQLTTSEMVFLQNNTSRPVQQHDPDDCVSIDEIAGCSVGVSRHLFASEWILTVGVVEVHQYAGVSGGYKGVVVGCGSRNSISRLHAREMVCHPKVEVGKIVDNPFRDEIERLGRLLPYTMGLMWVPSLREWWLGNPEDILLEASTCILPWKMVQKMYDGVVLHVSSVKGVSLYQASRAATYLALSPRPPLNLGAKIIIDAQMPEGLGSESGFVEALNRFSASWTEVLEVDIQGAGSQRMWMLARLAQRYQLYVRGVDTPEVFEAVGIPVYNGVIPSDWLQVYSPFNEIPQIAN